MSNDASAAGVAAKAIVPLGQAAVALEDADGATRSVRRKASSRRTGGKVVPQADAPVWQLR